MNRQHKTSRALLGALLALSTLSLWSQTTKQELFDNLNKTAGVHYAYPDQNLAPQTPAPKGYEPCYISHFGRHGSRYLVNDSEYKELIDLLTDADQHHALTSQGKALLNQLTTIWAEVALKGGDLSPVGVKEQRRIAQRMHDSYPQVFGKTATVDACATTVVRCILSMSAFCDQLKGNQPTLVISQVSGDKYQQFLNFHTPEAVAYRSGPNTWQEAHRKFEAAHINGNRLVNTLFADSTYINQRVNPHFVISSLYAIAGNIQNLDTQSSLYPLFEKQELFDLWQCRNYARYVEYANYAATNELMMNNAKPVLRHLIEHADQALASNSTGATLRFAHDGNIIPLAMLLHLADCYNSVSDPNRFYQAWSDFKVAPMAGNIQLIFYRKPGSQQVLVKFLLHEKEVLIPPLQSNLAPYYPWSEVKKYYQSLLAD